MTSYLTQYIKAHKEALDAIPLEQVATLIDIFGQAWQEDRKIFVFGNGGSAANASHFVTDLGKGASDTLEKPFHCLSFNDNMPWVTAIGNDYSFEDVFLRQLKTLASPGDLLFTMSVSGNSPNLVAAVKWAKEQGIYVISLVGANRGQLAELSDFVIAIDSTHYGRVEDAHMGICHMICYAFIEQKVKLQANEQVLSNQ
ncbi:MAG TPA: SIS domain-containing protein [Flavisolibacter sp.]|jgi:D-sedoheptulose 7-phosphate isomerase|nr:SIS domain-containing protein [Flavisolibacter sp.]